MTAKFNRLEIDFFDRVAESLGVSPPEIAGLIPGNVEDDE